MEYSTMPRQEHHKGITKLRTLRTYHLALDGGKGAINIFHTRDLLHLHQHFAQEVDGFLFVSLVRSGGKQDLVDQLPVHSKVW